ncbi:methyltransferase domain-containing protein [Xylariales sp. AK1849]|nr:methyltransferase domain-containing protein [Xylariales sp. AK1849]
MSGTRAPDSPTHSPSGQIKQEFDSTATTPGFLAVDEDPNDFSVRGRQTTGHSVLEDDSVHEHGRTYQGYRQDKYFLPNDGEEQDRLDMQHAAIVLTMDGQLGWAPVNNPSNVLDIGAGTGIWALEFARDHPQSTVFGTELSLIQPKDEPPNALPPNCFFVREDAEEDWTLNSTFDYIHLRMMFSCFDDPRKVMTNSFNHLSPGGWIEFQELYMEFQSFDGSSQGTALENWSRLMVAGSVVKGRDLLRIKHYKALLESVGFEDVEERLAPFPCSEWASEPQFKEAGRAVATFLSQSGMEGMSLKLLSAAGLSPVEIRDTIAGAVSDLRNRDIHGYWPFFVIYGRKPHAWEQSIPQPD